MAKRSKRAKAAAGTKADPERRAAVVEEGTGASMGARASLGNGAVAGDGATVGAGAVAGEGLAPGMNSKREQLTRRIFLGVQVALAVIPIAFFAMGGVATGTLLTPSGLQQLVEASPAAGVSLLAAFAQPFVAYLLHIVRRHYERGDFGYAAGNLAGLICAEMLMQNMMGIVGVAVLLWRVWPRCSGNIGSWAARRGVGGVAADVSGALVMLALAALVAFASWRIG